MISVFRCIDNVDASFRRIATLMTLLKIDQRLKKRIAAIRSCWVQEKWAIPTIFTWSLKTSSFLVATIRCRLSRIYLLLTSCSSYTFPSWSNLFLNFLKREFFVLLLPWRLLLPILYLGWNLYRENIPINRVSFRSHQGLLLQFVERSLVNGSSLENATLLLLAHITRQILISLFAVRIAIIFLIFLYAIQITNILFRYSDYNLDWLSDLIWKCYVKS